MVTVSRALRQSDFPRALPAGGGDESLPLRLGPATPRGRCGCSAEIVQRYRAKLSGPLMDRIDLQLAVPRLPPHDMRPDSPRGEPSAPVRERVLAARERQLARDGTLNAHLGQAQTEAHCRLEPRDQALLETAMETLQLSARAMHRILRVARHHRRPGRQPSHCHRAPGRSPGLPAARPRRRHGHAALS